MEPEEASESTRGLRDCSYIGDGVYVGHDGYQLWLYANHHLHPTDRVALPFEVYDRLEEYVKELKERYGNKS